MGKHRQERRSERRVHLSEAAEIMGVSKDAVRMRVKRGTLRSEKGEDGRVYVWVNVNPDGDPNGVYPQGEVDPYRELVEELRDRVRSLEEANRENRRIIAGLVQRVPELAAPSPQRPPERAEPAEPAEPAASERSEPERVDPRRPQPERVEPEKVGPERPSAEEPQRRRSWWREFFGFD